MTMQSRKSKHLASILARPRRSVVLCSEQRVALETALIAATSWFTEKASSVNSSCAPWCSRSCCAFVFLFVFPKIGQGDRRARTDERVSFCNGSRAGRCRDLDHVPGRAVDRPHHGARVRLHP